MDHWFWNGRVGEAVGAQGADWAAGVPDRLPGPWL